MTHAQRVTDVQSSCKFVFVLAKTTDDVQHDNSCTPSFIVGRQSWFLSLIVIHVSLAFAHYIARPNNKVLYSNFYILQLTRIINSATKKLGVRSMWDHLEFCH